MYVEQMLRDCEVCNRRFAVQYEFAAGRIPSRGSDLVMMRVIPCPSCGHQNPLFMSAYVFNLVIKAVPGPDPTEVRFRANTVRRLRARPGDSGRARPRTGERKLRLVISAAAEFVRRVGPPWA